MSKLRMLINDEADSLAAGADLFLLQAVTDYVSGAQALDPRPQADGTTSTARMVLKSDTSAFYKSFVSGVIRFLYRQSSDVLITSSIEAVSVPSAAVQATLPGYTLGHTITVQGTVQQVNRVMRSVFYFAPDNTNGNVTFSVTVTDRPGSCLLPLADTIVSPTLDTQPFNYPTVPYAGFNVNNSASYNQSLLCDMAGPQTTRVYIPVFVIAVNQAPEFLLSEEAFTTILNVQTSVPRFSVFDIDHGEVRLNNSFGFSVEAPVSVVAFVTIGRLSLPVLDDVALLQGTGLYDRTVSLSGALNSVNTALSAMLYSCRTQDGCAVATSDTIQLSVNDLGFYGKGGAMTAAANITVTAIAA
jgi:hypothetical protein